MRLIDADKIRADSDERFLDDKPYEEAWGLTMVDSAPTIDAVPVVRCKDCEYGEQADEFSYICNNGAWVHLFCWADDFCSRGIRREKNEQVDQR